MYSAQDLVFLWRTGQLKLENQLDSAGLRIFSQTSSIEYTKEGRYRGTKAVVGNRGGNIIRWTRGGRRKIKSRGAGNHKAPHCLNAHMWTTVDPALAKKNPGTHTFIWIRADRQTRAHAIHSLSHSTTGWHGLKRKTEQQRIGRGRPQTQGGNNGVSWTEPPPSVATGAAVGETAVPHFLMERPSWKIPH